MSEVTFNSQSLTTDAVNYTDSVDKLKQAAKPFMNEAGVINITRETTMEDAKKIENYTSQIFPFRKQRLDLRRIVFYLFGIFHRGFARNIDNTRLIHKRLCRLL